MVDLPLVGFFAAEGKAQPFDNQYTVTPSQQLATVLREGAGLHVHVLVWCDSLNNLNRSFDRPVSWSRAPAVPALDPSVSSNH